MHLHAFDLQLYKEMLGQSKLTQKEYLENVIEILERNNIIAIASGDYNIVKDWVKRSPTRIIPGFCGPDYYNIDSLRSLINRSEMKVIAEIAPQYEGISPSDSVLEPIWKLAEELDIPVGIHMGLGPPDAAKNGAPKYRARLSNPLLIEETLIRHPDLRVYIMHAGWPMLDELIHILYSYSQVYVDVGVIDWYVPREEFYFYLKRIVNAGYCNRVMFGSDEMIWTDSIEKAIEAIKSADFLTEAQKRDILYNNAVRFLRLDSNIK